MNIVLLSFPTGLFVSDARCSFPADCFPADCASESLNFRKAMAASDSREVTPALRAGCATRSVWAYNASRPASRRYARSASDPGRSE